jgi:hypothetical protein
VQQRARQLAKASGLPCSASGPAPGRRGKAGPAAWPICRRPRRRRRRWFRPAVRSAHAVHPHELRVAARDQQGDERELGRIGAQKRRQQMPFEVVHRPAPVCPAPWPWHRPRPNPPKARPPGRATGVGDGVHRRQRQAGLGQHRVGQREHAADVVAAGQLGHHAAIGLVHLDLAVQRLAQAGAAWRCHWRRPGPHRFRHRKIRRSLTFQPKLHSRLPFWRPPHWVIRPAPVAFNWPNSLRPGASLNKSKTASCKPNRAYLWAR